MSEQQHSNVRARAKAWAAEIDAARRRAGPVLPGEIEAFLRRLRQIVGEWAIAEVAPGRLVPWLAVAFGAGIVFYFTADREPELWAVLPLAALSFAIAYAARRHAVGFPLALGFACLACGFAVATLNTARWRIRCCARRHRALRSLASSRCAKTARPPSAPKSA